LGKYSLRPGQRPQAFFRPIQGIGLLLHMILV
jgi:hypothetical protein